MCVSNKHMMFRSFTN